MNTFFIILLVITSVIIIATTLIMEPVTRGAGSMYGQDTNAFGLTSHQSKEKTLQKVMIISGVIFVVSLIAIVAL